MKTAVIGLGDIAEKAYLPVLATQPGLDLHLCTRDRRALDRLGDVHRVAARFTSVGEVIEAGVEAAFVHAATTAHRELVEPLLKAGVHVFVDKPLADNLPDCEHLVRLAHAERRSLMVGFNRRYAPGYVGLAALPRDLVLLQKNRADRPEDPRRMVFDDFIHVVDTLRFLAPGEVTGTRIRTRVTGGLAEHVVLELTGDGFTAIGSMCRVSGAAEESCEVMGGGVKRRVVNLGDVVDYAAGETLVRRPDWVPVARQRGIEQACLEFLDAVHAGRLLTADDALVSHAICEDIVRQAQTGNTSASNGTGSKGATG
ncbi:Gfo/Idh/MocA family oxidoreductase [Nonomuraea sp. NPDC005501]|uniref:Gfo/Idh/MocA family protein n=1 Tax=Nonomuraea sp. NPDC005501 TaxID=3156884 RepID=UPI0033A29DEF